MDQSSWWATSEETVNPKVTYVGVVFYPSPPNSRCTAECWHCSNSWWQWLKEREANMGRPMEPKLERRRNTEFGPSYDFVVRAGGPAFSDSVQKGNVPG